MAIFKKSQTVQARREINAGRTALAIDNRTDGSHQILAVRVTIDFDVITLAEIVRVGSAAVDSF